MSPALTNYPTMSIPKRSHGLSDHQVRHQAVGFERLWQQASGALRQVPALHLGFTTQWVTTCHHSAGLKKWVNQLGASEGGHMPVIAREVMVMVLGVEMMNWNELDTDPSWLSTPIIGTIGVLLNQKKS